MSSTPPSNLRKDPLNSPRIILLPINLKARFHAINEPLSSLLDWSRLTSILSKEDVSFYFWCQHNFSRLFFKPVMKTLYVQDLLGTAAGLDFNDEISSYYGKLYEFDVQSHLPEDQTDPDAMEDISYRLNIRPFYDGLFSTKSGGLYLKDYVFETTEITNDVFALTLVPVNNLESVSKQLLHSYEELLSHLRRYVPLPELGLTALFEAFCQASMANG